jgi:hypothetical protein
MSPLCSVVYENKTGRTKEDLSNLNLTAAYVETNTVNEESALRSADAGRLWIVPETHPIRIELGGRGTSNFEEKYQRTRNHHESAGIHPLE